MTLYEERFTQVALGATGDYLKYYREHIVPFLSANKGRALLVLTGLIGDPANSVLQISRFQDLDSWQKAQKTFPNTGKNLVENESVRLLRSIASRPKAVIPKEDHRPVYGYRRLFIDPGDLDKFVEYSEKGVWPLYEACDCPVFGLFSPVWATNPLEIVLMGSYRGPGHWEETRFISGKPANVSDEIWETGRDMNIKRSRLSVRGSWVRLWTSHEI